MCSVVVSAGALWAAALVGGAVGMFLMAAFSVSGSFSQRENEALTRNPKHASMIQEDY